MDLHDALAQYGTELPGVSAIQILKEIFNLKDSLCERLVERFGSSLHGLFHGVTVTDLKALGCTKSQSERILMAVGIGRKMTAVETAITRLSSPADIYAIMAPIFAGKLQEEMWCLCLDCKNRVISKRMVTMGLADRSLVHPRELFRQAISLNAMRIALAHNHPSGDPTPSQHDIESTRMLTEAGRIVGIEIIDHIVVGRPGVSSAGNPGYASFRELGLLKQNALMTAFHHEEKPGSISEPGFSFSPMHHNQQENITMSDTISELAALKTINFDAGLIFSGTSSQRPVVGYEAPSSFTPAKDPGYVFHETSREVIVWFLSQSDPLYLFGPTGSGKTSLIKQLAAKLNYPVFEITGHSRLEYPDMVGHLAVENGSMTFQYGPLALAMKYGGLFLLNEIDLLDPATAAGLNTVLDGAPLCIPEKNGELVQRHPNFRFAATANTNGASDEHGLYQGTLRQNLAFMDRFWLCEIAYPEASTEEALLKKAYPALPEAIRTKMVAFAGEVRKLFMGGDGATAGPTNRIEVTLSTRTLLRWADLTLRFQPLANQGIKPVHYALDRALAYRASRESRAVLHELTQRIFATNA